MNQSNLETLHRIEQNDCSLIKLSIGSMDCGFDFNRLGRAIATNNYIWKFEAHLLFIALNITDTEFYEGLKQNTSIEKLIINCDEHARNLNGVGYEILQAYQENNHRLTTLNITHPNLQDNGGATEITTTLQCCANLTHISLYHCNITAAILLPMTEIMRGRRSLEKLFLNNNNIGNAGCEALATLLEDTNCNITNLCVSRNGIGNEGAIAIANSLANNTKLQKFDLSSNPIIIGRVQDTFSRILCNATSLNDIYASNHTLEMLSLGRTDSLHNVEVFLEMNESANKSHVSIRKIIKYQSDIDMTPLFGWDNDGEWTLKALPYVINWFEKARIAEAIEFNKRNVPVFVQEMVISRISRKTLSSIYKFAKAMPMLIVPTNHAKMYDKKRKRVN